ncbi:MAG: hypothetical protein ACRCTC_06885 [Cetobacterium sp.]
MKLFLMIKIIICSFIFTACSIVGYRTSEEAGYSLISAGELPHPNRGWGFVGSILVI